MLILGSDFRQQCIRQCRRRQLHQQDITGMLDLGNAIAGASAGSATTRSAAAAGRQERDLENDGPANIVIRTLGETPEDNIVRNTIGLMPAVAAYLETHAWRSGITHPER
jgi:hypothetical protein